MNRGLFLDRDGVINIDHGYVCAREKFTFSLGLFPFLREAQNKGYRLVIVTNQSGVARGLYTEKDYQTLTGWMLNSFRSEGITLALALACFEHREGTIDRYRRESFWRKPNPGMILEAAQKLRLDLKRSVMIGDHERDMQAAEAAGIGTRLLMSQKKESAAPRGAKIVTDFAEALESLA